MCSGRSTVLHAHDWQELRLQLEKQASGSQPHPQTPSPAGPAPAKDEAATARFFAEHWARLEMPPRPLCLASRPVALRVLVRDFGRRAGPALAGMSVAMPGGRGSPGLGHANQARAGPGIDGGPGPASRRGAVATPWLRAGLPAGPLASQLLPQCRAEPPVGADGTAAGPPAQWHVHWACVHTERHFARLVKKRNLKRQLGAHLSTAACPHTDENDRHNLDTETLSPVVARSTNEHHNLDTETIGPVVARSIRFAKAKAPQSKLCVGTLLRRKQRNLRKRRGLRSGVCGGLRQLERLRKRWYGGLLKAQRDSRA